MSEFDFFLLSLMVLDTDRRDAGVVLPELDEDPTGISAMIDSSVPKIKLAGQAYK